MKLPKKSQLLMVALAAVLIIGAGLWLYMRQVTSMLSSNILNTMQEIAAHDKSFIENSLDRSCTSLDRIGQRLSSEKSVSLQDLQTKLSLELASNSFQYLYLIDNNGTMYSGALLIQDGSHLSYVQNILKGVPRTITRSVETTVVDSQDETIVYAVPIQPFKVENKLFVGLVGQTIINDVRRHMTASSFAGQGTSLVIDKDGYYIVNWAEHNGIGQQDNIFDNLQSAKFLDHFSMDKVKAEINQGHNFHCSYILQDTSYVLCMSPFNVTDWYLAVTVPAAVFTKQSKQFMFMTLSMLFISLLIIISLAIGLFKIWRLSIEARANAEAKANFLSKMSHEIRTPLNALTGLNYLMLVNLQDSTKLKYYLDKSANTSQYLLSLINDILDISKLEQSGIVLEQEPFSLINISTLLHEMLRGQLEKKAQTFVVEDKIPQPIIIGDEMRLKQVLLNVLSNAIKFTPENGHISMQMTQTPGSSKKVITTIKITDDGIGISEKFQKHIFESFTQERGQAASHNEQQGSGLGMAISYLLMQQMGGSLSVASTLGKGSCFTLVLPAEPGILKQTAPEITVPVQTVTAQGSGLHLLIAEDNKLNADILVNILRREGYKTSVAVNGREAVEMFAGSAPNYFGAILMDAQMPVMDGYTATKKIRALAKPDAKTIPIYACTANTAKEDREKALATGMNGFIAKPIDIKKLLAILKKLS